VYLVIDNIVNVVGGILFSGQVTIVLEVPVIYGIDADAPFPEPFVNVGAVPVIVAFRPFPVKSYNEEVVLFGCPALYAPQGVGNDIFCRFYV
jgi:hypothetical protein